MKKLLLASIAFTALITGPATAADLARPVYRRPAMVAAPVYTWTGFYVGGNVGYSWGEARTDVTGSGTFVAIAGFPSSVGFADSDRAHLDGVIGGGQIGYNYQFSPNWVFGVEADIQGSGERRSNAFVDSFSGTICIAAVPNNPPCQQTGVLNGTAVTDYEAKIKWFGTVRGRLGVLITDHVLLYGTGGLAYGEVEVSSNTAISAAAPIAVTPGSSSFSASKTNVGFAVGGGMEGKCSYWLPAGWTWKLEYLYLDLGSLDGVSSFNVGPVLLATRGSTTTHTHFTDNIVRVGLNYKFGYAAAPAVYK